MMVTIHGLPAKWKYYEVKGLIKRECKIFDFILDNLIPDGSDDFKKVHVGLSDDAQGYHVMKCLNGYCLQGDHILKVVPVGKDTQQPQNNYNTAAGFTNQSYDYTHQTNYGRSQGSMMVGLGHAEPMITPAPRTAVWATNKPNPQWIPNQPITQPVQTNYSNYQQLTDAPYQQPQVPRLNLRTRDSLRTVELVETTHQQIRYGVQDRSFQGPEKPITIMKDNFQGPTAYNLNEQMAQSQSYPGHQVSGHGHERPQPWAQTNPQSKPPAYKPEYDDRREGRIDAHKNQQRPTFDKRPPSPHGRRPPSPRRTSPVMISPARVDTYGGRGLDRSMRRPASPPPRRISSERQMISGRPVSPPVRLGPGRAMSPYGRRGSPGKREEARGPPSTLQYNDYNYKAERRMGGRPDSPRRYSPQNRQSPKRCLMSPPRQRYSPQRHHEKSSDQFMDPDSKVKSVRPAYESKAPNQAMYSGGYRPGPQAPQSSGPHRISPWHQDGDKPMYPNVMKKDDDRRDFRMGRTEDLDKRRSPMRKSRSPTRRDRSPVRTRSPVHTRSPVRARYNRDSPSPRSPRRSWALEKRRSPVEAPPPPIWPGQSAINDKHASAYDTEPHGRSFDKSMSMRENYNKNIPSRDNFDRELPGRSDYNRAIPRTSVSDKDHGNFGKDVRDRERVFERDVPTRPHFEKDMLGRPEFDKHNPERGSFSRERHDRHHIDVARNRPFTKEDKPVHSQVPEWTPRRIADDRRLFEDKYRDHKNIGARDREDSRFQPKGVPKGKFSPREDFEDHREHHRQNMTKHDARDYHRSEDRRPEPHHDDTRHLQKKDFKAFDKDFEDIYKRAVEFRKKTEELRRSSDHKRGYSEELERRGDDGRRDRPYRESPPPHDMRHVLNSKHIDYEKTSPEWQTERKPRMIFISPEAKTKRDNAVNEIADRIISRHSQYADNSRVIEEVKLTVSKVLVEMFGNEDISYIELVIKYRARYDEKEEDKLFWNVLSSLPSHFRSMKRSGPEPSEVPAKLSKPSSTAVKEEINMQNPIATFVPGWNLNPTQPPQMFEIFPNILPSRLPLMVPSSFIPTFEEIPQTMVYQQPNIPNFDELQKNDGYHLFLCKDDFSSFTEHEAESLRAYLVSQIVTVSEQSQGWAPDFTLKGLQSFCRYEIVTFDDGTRDWLIGLDFSDFMLFNVQVYTRDELWYERAAIWLPGHSRSRNLEPFQKLILQNSKLLGVNIRKWKFIKKIVTTKGTRLYVDMPPSAARALHNHKMMLSYELQKVTVILRAVAVDKEAFDAGLKEFSLKHVEQIAEAVQNTPIPTLPYEADIVKIVLNGAKSLSVVQARKIKEMIIYHLCKYLQTDATKRTDFVKYGIVSSSYFGVVPENAESREWLVSLNLGKLNRQAVKVVDGINTRYFELHVYIPLDTYANAALVVEKLRQSNQGVKGINYNLWKPFNFARLKDKCKLTVEIDLESVETLSTMNYQLDYVNDKINGTAYFKANYPLFNLERNIQMLKSEMIDDYAVKNMDLDNEYDDDDDDEDSVICLD